MNKVKARRVALDMRKEELAAVAEISLSYVNLLESDDPPNPGLDKARRIAKALRTTVDKLFPEPEPMTTERAR